MIDSIKSIVPHYFGPPFERPFAAILNSRQSKTPCGSEPWIQNTIKAIDFSASEGLTVLSSVGMHTWNILTWASGDRDANQIVVLPLLKNDDPENIIERVTGDFNLTPERTEFLFFETGIPSNRPKLAWAERDRAIAALADVIYPVSLRKRGNMEQLIQERATKEGNIVEDFTAPYSPRKREKLRPLDPEAVAEKFPVESWDFVTHWTHCFDGPWPNESEAEYYSAVCSSGSEYCRTAMDSILHILEKLQIYGTKGCVRGGLSAVSFTSLPPSEAVKLMRWHSRKTRYTFEPYGLAVKRNIVETMGVRPVIYGNSTDFESLPEKDRPYFHSKGAKGDWPAECEWRYIGDFDISMLPKDSYMTIVRSEKDAEKMRSIADVPVVALEA